MAASSPTALKWWLAVELRRLREAKGISREQAAKAIRGSVASIGHFEVGRVLPPALALDKLLEIYGVPERSDFLQELRARAKSGRDWFVRFGELGRPEFDLFLGLESSAVRVETFDAIVVTGLFQTAHYAEAVVRGAGPELSDAEVARRVEVRMARQPPFLEAADAPPVHAVLTEGALRLQVGPPELMRAQLSRLIELTRRRNINLQVLPACAGAHPGVDGTFSLLSAPLELKNYVGCVHIETLLRSFFYSEPEQIGTYREALMHLRRQALSQTKSLELIDRLVGEL